MAITLPSSPTVGQTYTTNNRTWTWTGTAWDAVGLPAVPTINHIHNADFSINQRGFTSTSVSGNTYGFDRWFVYANGDGSTIYSSQTFAPGVAPVSGYEGTNYARIVTANQTTLGSESDLIQRIEDVRTLAGQTATLSFWARSGSGTPSISIEFLQNFGSGGSSSVIINGGKVVLNTTWTRYSVTVNIPSLAGKTIGTGSFLHLQFWLSASSAVDSRTNALGLQANTFEFWGVQLEAGAVATAFKRNSPSYALELATCQRFYCIAVADFGFYAAAAGANCWIQVILPVTQRASATITSIGVGTNTNAYGATTPAYLGGNSYRYSFSATAIGACYRNESFSFSAEL